LIDDTADDIGMTSQAVVKKLCRP